MNAIQQRVFTPENLTIAKLRRMFYLVTPNETMFQYPEQVPNYIDEAVAWLMVFVALELLYSTIMKKNYFRINDTIISLSSGILQQTLKILCYTFEFTMACWIYENYGLHFLNWDSIWTWIIAFILVDFTYYWFHRGAHEINFFWAFHQMHHSSEDYNLATALRQGMFQPYLATFYNLPEAFILPPAVHLAHLGLNKINQFWVHTQVIKSLGPLEHILVTPSHHRVHHGRNPYCIDKNYSGTFIIWDKLFGTFQAEKEEEPVVFGLVHNVNTFDPLYCQLFHFKHIFLEKVPSMKTFGDKLKAIFYGPGWFPGTPRMGNLSDIPEVCQKIKVEHPVQKYDVDVPNWLKLYLFLQMNFTNVLFLILNEQRDSITFFEALLYAALIIFSVHCIGLFLEDNPIAPRCELIRCIILHYFLLPVIWPPNIAYKIYVNALFALSTAIWLITVLTTRPNKKANIE